MNKNRYMIFSLILGSMGLTEGYIRYGWVGSCVFAGLIVVCYVGVRLCGRLMERGN